MLVRSKKGLGSLRPSRGSAEQANQCGWLHKSIDYAGTKGDGLAGLQSLFIDQCRASLSRMFGTGYYMLAATPGLLEICASSDTLLRVYA